MRFFLYFESVQWMSTGGHAAHISYSILIDNIVVLFYRKKKLIWWKKKYERYCCTNQLLILGIIFVWNFHKNHKISLKKMLFMCFTNGDCNKWSHHANPVNRNNMVMDYNYERDMICLYQHYVMQTHFYWIAKSYY
jgi:hypothetical protein